MNFNYYLLFIIFYSNLHLFFYQIKIFNLKDPSSCLKHLKVIIFLD